MLRIALAAALAAGLATAALAQTTPTTSTPAATTTKKPPSGGLAAARERQKKCGAEWKEAKKAGKVEKGMTWPKYWSACNKRLKSAGCPFDRQRRFQKPKGVGESLCLADALSCHPVPGRRRAPRCAGLSQAATGPYDAIFNTRTCEDRDVASELEPLLPALFLRRLLRCLSLLRHLLPS